VVRWHHSFTYGVSRCIRSCCATSRPGGVHPRTA